MNHYLLSHSFNALGNADIVISKLLNTTIDELLNANK